MCQLPHQVYRPRQPEKTELYQIVAENLDYFYEVYDERFLAQYGPLSAHVRQAFEAYLRCGRAQFGFCRIRCELCGHEMLVAFSGQRRGICPSCGQKRAEILCRFLTEEVIEPVGHRQLVFVLPKRFRALFHRDRELLGGLCRAAFEATTAFYRAGIGRDDVKVGMVIVPQLFGDKVNSHCHIHAIVTDGAFDSQGDFHLLPIDAKKDVETLKKLFEKAVLDLLVRHERLSQKFRDEILGWEHTGFSVDASIKVFAGDRGRFERLVRYIARPAVSVERVSYDAKTGTVTVRSAKKLHGQRPVVATYDALTFLALLALQVPPPGSHLTRYYGWYSSVSRARRGAIGGHREKEASAEIPPPPVLARRRAWADLLRQVLEVDPLTCPECGGEMKVIAFITTSQQDLIDKILDHLGEDTESPKATGPPLWVHILQAKEHGRQYQDWYPEDQEEWDAA